MARLQKLFTAIIKRWWALMSCAAWTLFAYITTRNGWAGDRIVRGMEILAVFFLVLAPVLAWWEESKKVEELERKIASNSPELHPVFHMDAVGQSDDGNQFYFFWLQITNKGGPSIAKLINLKAISPNGKSLPLGIWPPHTKDIHIEKRGITIKAAEHFVEAFMKNPIERGMAPCGWLEVHFQTDRIPIGTKFSAEIEDVDGKRTPMSWVYTRPLKPQ